MPDEVKPEAVVSPVVSPTGAPVVPPRIAPYALLAVTAAVAVTMGPDVGIALPAAVLSVAKLVVLIGTLLGIASPGVRK